MKACPRVSLALALTIGTLSLPFLQAQAQNPSAAPAKRARPAAKPPAAKTATTAADATKSFLDKATLEGYVRHLFVWGPAIQVSVSDPKPSRVSGFSEVVVRGTAGAASQEETFLVSRDGKQILQGRVFDVDKNPFFTDLAKLKTEFQPSMGTPGAPVVLVLFTDYQCNFCRDEAKMLRDNLLSAYPKEVRLYLKDFPIEQIHPWAKTAAIAGRCVFRQDPAAFWDYHDWVFDKQREITSENFKSKFLEFAGSKQLDVLQLTRCLDTRATEAEVNQSIAEARALNVTATPTLFVNGRRLAGNPGWPSLRQIIDFEIEYQKTARNAGEDCGCEVKLPSPLGNE
jgi:protein-disulfide isomerase